jgi:hypothetical protein
LASCQEDMKALWSDEAVKMVLKKRKLRLEDTAGLYVAFFPVECTRELTRLSTVS